MRLMSYFLGIEVQQSNDGIFVSQRKYTIDILKIFKMDAFSLIQTPIVERMVMKRVGSGEFVDQTYFRSIMGSLCYLTSTRPDIIYGVRLISCFMEKPY